MNLSDTPLWFHLHKVSEEKSRCLLEIFWWATSYMGGNILYIRLTDSYKGLYIYHISLSTVYIYIFNCKNKVNSLSK